MELKTYTPVEPKFVFEKIKFKSLHYIQHDFICQRLGPSKDQIIMFKKQYQTFYREVKRDLFGFREVQNVNYQDFQYLAVSIHFFHGVATSSFMANKLQQRKKKIQFL